MLTPPGWGLLQNIAQYKIAAHVTWPMIDLAKIGKTKVDSFEVEVFDSVAPYVEMLRSIFDFESIKNLVSVSPLALPDCWPLRKPLHMNSLPHLPAGRGVASKSVQSLR